MITRLPEDHYYEVAQKYERDFLNRQNRKVDSPTREAKPPTPEEKPPTPEAKPPSESPEIIPSPTPESREVAESVASATPGVTSVEGFSVQALSGGALLNGLQNESDEN